MDNARPQKETPRPELTKSRQGIRHLLPCRRAILAAMFLMIPWVLITVPGAKVVSRRAANVDRVHGWPFPHYSNLGKRTISPVIFARNVLPDSPTYHQVSAWGALPETLFGIPGEAHFWSEPGNWFYYNPNGDIRLSWKNLFVNLGIGSLILFGCIFILEYRIRKRGSLFRFSLTDGLVAAMAFAYLLAIPINERNGASNDSKVIAQLNPVRDNESLKRFGFDRCVGEQSQLPVWLERLSDYRIQAAARRVDPNSNFNRVVSLRLACSDSRDSSQYFLPAIYYSSGDTPGLVEALNKLTHLNSITLSVDNFSQCHFLSEIRSNRIRKLSIGARDPQPGIAEDFEFLTRFKNLESLSVLEYRTDGLDRVSTDCWKAGLLKSIQTCRHIKEIIAPNMSFNDKDSPSLLNLGFLARLECAYVPADTTELLTEGNPNLEIVLIPFHQRMMTSPIW